MIKKFNSNNMEKIFGGTLKLIGDGKVLATTIHSKNNIKNFLKAHGYRPTMSGKNIFILSNDELRNFKEHNGQKLFKSRVIDDTRYSDDFFATFSEGATVAWNGNNYVIKKEI